MGGILISSLFLSLCIPLISLAAKARPLDIPSKGRVTRSLLDNGLTLIIKEVLQTGLISIDVRVKAGSAYEKEFSGTGITHLVEHMIFKGTPSLGPSEIEKRIRSYGGEINAATSYDYTSFTITIPNEHFSSALEILSDSLFNAKMHPAEIKKESNVILKEIRLNRDDPVRYLSQILWNTCFTVHPYRHPIIGYETLFKKLTRDDVLKYYKEIYTPNNMVLCLAGDIKTDFALAEVKKYFEKIERGPSNEEMFSRENTQLSKRSFNIERDVQLAYFALGYHSVDLHHKDMAALDMLAGILGGGDSSRLNSNIYRTKELVYSIGSWNYTPRDPGLFIISGVAKPDKLKPALGAIKEELYNIQKNSIKDSELERVRAMIRADYVYSLEALSDQARDLATSQMFTNSFDFSKKYLELLDSVTKDNISEAAKLYLNEDSLSLVTIVPTQDALLQTPAHQKSAERKLEKIILSNGLRVLLMEKSDIPAVSIISASLGGLRAEHKDNVGISSITALMMPKGAAGKTEEEISENIELIGASLNSFSGNNTFGIKLDFLKGDLDTGLELFKDILLNPDFPEDAFERERETTIAGIKASLDDIFQLGMKNFKNTLFKTHPYRFQKIGTISTVKNLSREDLIDFHKKYLVPENTVIAVIGDISIEKIKPRLEDIFGQLKNKTAPLFTTAIEPKQTAPRQNIVKAHKEQSLLIMGFKGTVIKEKDRYILQFITTALSGISGRLAVRLRGELGIAYAVGAVSHPALDPGYIALYIATTKNHIERAKKEFIHQIKHLVKKGLTKEEIAFTKNELIGSQRIALQTNAAIAYQIALDELYGMGFEHYLQYKNIINSITNKEITEISKKYFKLNSSNTVIVEGEGK